jgi:hypothetical protein
MQGRVDTSFQTLQRDLFASGLAAKIGMNAFGVWLAIKSHADYNTGKAWPGMRRLSDLTGLSLGLIHRSVQTLVDAHLLRVEKPSKGGRRGQTYVACERMDVRLGDRVLCTIVLDYVPATLRQTLNSIDQALTTGEATSETFAQCLILPGPGFAWDDHSKVLKAAIPAKEIPPPELSEEQMKQPLVQRVLAIQERAKGGGTKK